MDSTNPLIESSAAQCIPPDDNLRKAARRLLKTYPLLKLALDDYLRERMTVLGHTPVGLPNPAAGGTHQTGDPTLAKLPQLEAIERRYADNLRRVKAVDDVLALLDAECRNIVQWYFWRGKTVIWIITHPEETQVYVSESTVHRRIKEVLDGVSLRMWLCGNIDSDVTVR